MDEVTRTALAAWAEEETERLLSYLQELVQINSGTKNIVGVNRVLDRLETSFNELGFDTDRRAAEGAGDILIARSGPADRAPVLLSGHADTVFSADSAFQDFGRDERRVYGPGVIDMKGGLVVMLWALKALEHFGCLNKLPVVAVINPDEEIGSPHSAAAIKELAQSAACAFVFEPERAGNMLITQRRGVLVYDIAVEGMAAHAGNAHQEGANAVVQLARLIVDASQMTDYRRGITCNVGSVRGGGPVNVVPNHAECLLELRVQSIDDFNRLRRELPERFAETSVPGTRSEAVERLALPPMEELPQNVTLFQELRECGRLVGVDFTRSEEPLGGGSNANDIAPLGIPTLDGLGPLGGNFHTEDEYAEIASFAPKINALVLWLHAFGLRSVEGTPAPARCRDKPANQ